MADNAGQVVKREDSLGRNGPEPHSPDGPRAGQAGPAFMGPGSPAPRGDRPGQIAGCMRLHLVGHLGMLETHHLAKGKARRDQEHRPLPEPTSTKVKPLAFAATSSMRNLAEPEACAFERGIRSRCGIGYSGARKWDSLGLVCKPCAAIVVLGGPPASAPPLAVNQGPHSLGLRRHRRTACAFALVAS